MDTTDNLHVNNLCCIRQQRNLFSELSFELHAGEMLLIEGENGSGKSSLLRLLAGFATCSQGEIRWRGKMLANIHDEYTQQLHYVGHANGIKSGLTIAENLQLSKHLSLSTSSACMNVLEALQLSSITNSLAKNLSAGQTRRLALARLLLIQRKLWLLDEPLTALDAATQTFFLSQLEMHLQKGGMAIVSSHQPIAFNEANVKVKCLRLESC